MYRLTEVRQAYRIAVADLADLGVDVSDFALREGSATYGRQWKIVRRDPVTGGERDMVLLGMTRDGAYVALRALSAGFGIVGNLAIFD